MIGNTVEQQAALNRAYLRYEVEKISRVGNRIVVEHTIPEEELKENQNSKDFLYIFADGKITDPRNQELTSISVNKYPIIQGANNYFLDSRCGSILQLNKVRTIIGAFTYTRSVGKQGYYLVSPYQIGNQGKAGMHPLITQSDKCYINTTLGVTVAFKLEGNEEHFWIWDNLSKEPTHSSVPRINDFWNLNPLAIMGKWKGYGTTGALIMSVKGEPFESRQIAQTAMKRRKLNHTCHLASVNNLWYIQHKEIMGGYLLFSRDGSYYKTTTLALRGMHRRRIYKHTIIYIPNQGYLVHVPQSAVQVLIQRGRSPLQQTNPTYNRQKPRAVRIGHRVINKNQGVRESLKDQKHD